MTDHPFDEVVQSAADVIFSGGTVHQKFTCAACGSRQTVEEPNKFFTSGQCEECGHITEITHCNYLAIFGAQS